ncbi:hypothetical protein nbrc107696_43100 [Gordonia spumicola]|uniref:Pentapeptide repeat protein n=2 Tax=Gordonia spumicola TaxID=589161 RepID=A0A7I9VEW5_9ACTN|nr:hypothetical protein nbrc107696_43100 [Gordonia spumicola]
MTRALELRDRWSADSAEASYRLLLQGTAASPFGTIDGRTDLRGLSVGLALRLDPPRRPLIRRALGGRPTVRDVDLSFAELDQWRIFDVDFENCRFDSAVLTSIRVFSASFTDCSFTSANLGGASLGSRSTSGGRRSRFDRCDFSGSDIRSASTTPGFFTHCDFTGTRWQHTRFLETVLEFCDFRSAVVDGSFFDGRRFHQNAPVGLGSNTLRGCDFSSTQLMDTTFSAIDFRHCIPPAGDSIHLIADYPRAVDDALTYLALCEGPDADMATMILGEEARSSRFLPAGAVGLLQLEHYPGAVDIVTRAFRLNDR